MLTMGMFSYLFGVSSNDLSTWARRGHPSLPGMRGHERAFGVEQQDDVLRVVFARVLSSAGRSLDDAFAVADDWVVRWKAGKLPRFYRFNPLTHAAELTDDETRIGIAGMQRETADYTGGARYADDRAKGQWLFGLAMTVVDLTEIIKRVTEAISESPEVAKGGQ